MQEPTKLGKETSATTVDLLQLSLRLRRLQHRRQKWRPLEEAEAQDQHDEEEEEESVTMSMSHFMALTNQAGVEVPEDEMIAAMADVNFG